jgi:hypothetical protein
MVILLKIAYSLLKVLSDRSESRGRTLFGLKFVYYDLPCVAMIAFSELRGV